jgi:hypothetical protein
MSNQIWTRRSEANARYDGVGEIAHLVGLTLATDLQLASSDEVPQRSAQRRMPTVESLRSPRSRP